MLSCLIHIVLLSSALINLIRHRQIINYTNKLEISLEFIIIYQYFKLLNVTIDIYIDIYSLSPSEKIFKIGVGRLHEVSYMIIKTLIYTGNINIVYIFLYTHL